MCKRKCSYSVPECSPLQVFALSRSRNLAVSYFNKLARKLTFITLALYVLVYLFYFEYGVLHKY